MKGMRYVHTNMIARDWRAPARFYQTLFGCVPVPPPSKTRFRNWYAVPPPLVQGFRSLRNPLSRRLLKKNSRCKAVAPILPDGYPGPSEAYSRYAAASAQADGAPVRRMGPRGWPFFSSLLACYIGSSAVGP
jgi:hypothetical protein